MIIHLLVAGGHIVNTKKSLVREVLEEVYPYIEKVDDLKEVLYSFDGSSVDELVRYLKMHIAASAEPLKTDLRIFLGKLQEKAGLM